MVQQLCSSSTYPPRYDAEWDRIINTNLNGAFLAAQAAARVMKAQESGGAIVNIASILGLRVAD
jgi:NAD(P)-dependent dehydrogenase (short-subunit alcohol dehydrogenase family)